MIRYTFCFDPKTCICFEVDEERGCLLGDDPPRQVPAWAQLERNRCAVCTLPAQTRRGCPAALAILPVVRAFDLRLSFERVGLTVEQRGSRLEAQVPTQNAVKSLVGLLLPLSDCPVLSRLRPMAYFHVPLATWLHTSYRFLGMHLTAQHLRAQDCLPADRDLSGLVRLLDQLHQVNVQLAERIRAIAREDATVNGVVLLDAFADEIQMDIEASLQEMRPHFRTYLVPDEQDE